VGLQLTDLDRREKAWLIPQASLRKSAYMLLVKLGQDERRQT
jgi:hypothetical protein